MSRIGRKPVVLPAGTKATVEGCKVTVEGPKGSLTRSFHPSMTIEEKGNELLVSRPNDEQENRALHGLTRALLHNMVVGVTDGFKKELEIIGVGYRASMQGKDLILNLGYSHPITYQPAEGLTIEVSGAQQNHIAISGASKEAVGQAAAEIRGMRPPEPYLGKGVRYVGEYVRHKEGKAGKK